MKQIGFDIRVLTLNAGGLNGGFTREGFVTEVLRDHKYEDGWRVDSVSEIQMSADGVSVLVFLTQWEDA